jgi:predicted dehydrogenase
MELLLADRGVALLIEKPLALDVVDGEKICARLARATRPVVVGYQWRHLAGLPNVREILAVNNPHLAIGHWLSSTPPAGWWGDIATSGSQFIEQATHLIDLSLHLLGPVVSVAATGSAERLRDSASGFNKGAGATLAFASGCVGSFVTCCVSPDSYGRSLDILVDGTAITISEKGCTISSDNGSMQLGHQLPDLYEREQQVFLDLVLNGGSIDDAPPLASVEESLAALRVTAAIKRSIVESRFISLDAQGRIF